MPIELGGLGLDPTMIGTIMSFLGILTGVTSLFLFSRMTDCMGVKGVYLMGVIAAVPCFSYSLPSIIWHAVPLSAVAT